MIIDAVALLPMTFFLTVLRFEEGGLDPQMDMLQMSFLLFVHVSGI
jgi:hypothetical protein